MSPAAIAQCASQLNQMISDPFVLADAVRMCREVPVAQILASLGM